jgi:fatty acid/phospholipid biosynthesis enzyme
LNGSLTVSVDAMGGDAGPSVVVAALARAVVRHPNVRFLLHGDEAELKPLFAKRGKLLEKIEIRHSPDRVRMEDKPSQVLRRGRNTSMWRTIESVAKKEAQVAISAGNTGALMASRHRRDLAHQARAERGAGRRRQHRNRRPAARRFHDHGRMLRARDLRPGKAVGRPSECRRGRSKGP